LDLARKDTLAARIGNIEFAVVDLRTRVEGSPSRPLRRPSPIVDSP
jgi:hypothetical protein